MIQTEAYSPCVPCTCTVGTNGLSDLSFNGWEITLHLFEGVSVYRGQRTIAGVSSVLPPHGVWGLSLAPQACWQALSVESSCWPETSFKQQFIFRHIAFPMYSLRAGARSRGLFIEWSLVMIHLCELMGKMPTLTQNMWERPSRWLSCHWCHMYLQDAHTRRVGQGMLLGSWVLVKPVAGGPLPL